MMILRSRKTCWVAVACLLVSSWHQIHAFRRHAHSDTRRTLIEDAVGTGSQKREINTSATLHHSQRSHRDMHVGFSVNDIADANIGTHVAIFSGGTASTGLLRVLMQNTTNVRILLPVTDDGGSSGEILRNIGGPAVGDFRSRLIAMMEEVGPDGTSVHTFSLRSLLNHRLSEDPFQAKREYATLIAGTNVLFNDVEKQWRVLIKHALNSFDETLLGLGRREHFNFASGSVGNFVLSGMRLKEGSLLSAIHKWKTFAGLPDDIELVPTIDSDEQVTLGALCKDGTFINGQNEISHPYRPQQGTKALAETPMPSKIDRLMFVSGGREVLTTAPKSSFPAIKAVNTAAVIVFSMGSLFTSIIASLALSGMGAAIRRNSCRKVLVLNSVNDRETTYLAEEESGIAMIKSFTVFDYLMAAATALHGYDKQQEIRLSTITDYITDVIYARGRCDSTCPLLISQQVYLHELPSEPGPKAGEFRMRNSEIAKKILELRRECL